MKKIIVFLICIGISTCFMACNAEPDHELWQQYKATDDPGSLFPDINTEKTILLDNEDYTITLYEQTAERHIKENYSGFLFGVKIENHTDADAIFNFTDIKVNGITIPEPDKVPFGGMSYANDEYLVGLIYVDYESLARANITRVDEVSFVMEVNEMKEEIKETTNESGSTTNVHNLERGKLLYTSEEITFKCANE